MKLLWAIVASFSLQAVDVKATFGNDQGSNDIVSVLRRDISLSNVYSPTHQNPVINPPIPIVALSSEYIGNATQDANGGSASGLSRRDGPELCGPGNACADGSCCSNNGTCGYGPDYCDQGKCQSNCDAKAMCGRFSDDGGTIKCGMNICCSYYGWCGVTENHCGNPDPHGLTPCQADFGLCTIVPPPSCAPGGGSTNGRTVGYYQASNVYDRVCNNVAPSQINTTGLTHMNFAFAQFDPKTFEVNPRDANDVPLYTEFTALKTANLQTWIAIGGFDFSDNGTSTFTAWSNMTQNADNRAAFIQSLDQFMSKYGFQGVDLDWEYPGTPERGGQRADTENYVALVKEMSAAYGSKYGISLTLAPDYWYLRGFDAKAMEPYVDFFGFMAYDLHGFWDADVKTLGSIARGQTDIRDISSDTAPLWFDALDPSKINFGLAYYGRGYTLANPSCNSLLCPFSGPSKPGPCTNFAGVMSLREIEHVIESKNLTSVLLESAMMKQITWDDQWMGYDDAETIALKKAWADGQCFGGTMIWSVDFNSGAGSGDEPPVTTDGSCGATHGGIVCGNWTTGNCCSSSGYCGSGDSYCGIGCQSGDCQSAGITTDGVCGAQHNDFYCGDWTTGSCCSSSGYCGNSSAYCGDGCQSGPCDGIPTLGSGPVYISPEIWAEPDPVVACYPPCTFIFPPLEYPAPTTIEQPPITLTLEEILPGLSTTTVETLTFPPLVTTEVDVWNVEWTDVRTTIIYITDSLYWTALTFTEHPPAVSATSSTTEAGIIWTYSPYPFPEPEPTSGPTFNPSPGQSTTQNPTPTTTPIPPGQQSSVHVTTGRPSPTCKPGEKCGSPCTANCGGSAPCTGICGCIGQCPGGGSCVGDCGGGDDGGDSSGDDGDTCELNVGLDLGLCPNGNFPIYDPVTGTNDCDYDTEAAMNMMDSCQLEAIQDPNSVDDAVNHEEDCNCPASSKRRRARAALALERYLLGGNQSFVNRRDLMLEPVEHLKTRCPSTTLATPQASSCHATFTCDFDQWPNLCANAKSAIVERGKTSILTYNYATADYHDVSGWYRNKYREGGSVEGVAEDIRAGTKGPRGGWGLIGCQVEEYPWGAGNPQRTFNVPDNVLYQHAVNRLIPQEENRRHGQAWGNFIKDQDPTGNRKYYNVHGLTVCVAFSGAKNPTGRSDDDYLLGDDQSENVCGQAYGPGFLLANRFNWGQKFDNLPNNPNWDPWWNNHLFEHTTAVVKGQALTASLPSQYCQAPAPGMKTWDSALNVWATAVGGVTYGTPSALAPSPTQKIWRRCDTPTPYSGPKGAKGPTKRDGEYDDSDDGLDPEVMLENDYMESKNATDSSSSGRQRRSLGPYLPVSNSLRARAAQGSYLDPRAIQILGCDNVDFDPCSWSEDCYTAPDDGVESGDDDDGSSPTGAPSGPPSTTSSPPSDVTFTVTNTQKCSVCTIDAYTSYSCSSLNGCMPSATATSTTSAPVTFTVTNTQQCSICTIDGWTSYSCNSLNGCTPSTSASSTTPMTPTTPTTPTSPATPTSSTCVLTGYSIIHENCGCDAHGSCTWCDDDTGFELKYVDGNLIGVSNTDTGGSPPHADEVVTIPAKELGYPTDLTWEANYVISYNGCSVNGQYKGDVNSDFCKQYEDGFTDCSTCAVTFPCPADLVTYPNPNCVVNAHYRDEWVENALARYRTTFYAHNTDVSEYCDEWNKCGLAWTNIQCGFDSQVDGGTWRIDLSTLNDATGSSEYYNCLTYTLNSWSARTGCRIG